MSIRNKLLLLFILFLIVPVGMIGTTLLITTSRIVERSSLARQQAELIEKRNEFIDQLEQWLSVLRLLQQTPEINRYYLSTTGTGIREVELRNAAALKVLRQTMRLYPALRKARILNIDGIESVRINRVDSLLMVVAEDKLQNKRHREFFSNLLVHPDEPPFVSLINLNHDFGEIEKPFWTTVRLGVPLFDDSNARAGFLLLNFDIGPLFEKLSHTDSGYIYIVNQNGTYLFHPDKTKEHGMDLQTSHSLASDNPDFFSSTLFESAGQVFINDSEQYAAWQSIPYAPGSDSQLLIITSAISRQEYLLSVQRSGMLFGTLLIATLALLVFLASQSARAITQPLTRMVEQARAIGTGNLAARVKTDGAIEFALLATEFNQMAVNLESAMITKEKLANEVDQRREIQSDLERSQTALLNILEDLKDQRSELQLSEKRFEVVLNSSPVALLMISQEGTISFANEEAEYLFGYSREELLNSSIEKLVPDRFAKALIALQKSFFGAPVRRSIGENQQVFAQNKEGREFPVSVALNPVDIDGKTSILSSVVDLTERIRVEQKLRFYNDEMEQLLYTVSHDLKAPLVTIHGFSGMIEKSLERGDTAEALDSASRVLRACRTMERTISDLLRLNRLGKQETEITEFDVSRLFEDVISAVAGEINRKRIQIIQEVEVPTINGDRRRMEQGLLNLLSNAAKYGCPADNLRIWLGVTETPQHFKFYVRDEGPGIDPKFHQSIFQLFQRLQRDTEGTGLGLSIVTKAARLLGGDAGLDSEPGKGATFWFSVRKL